MVVNLSCWILKRIINSKCKLRIHNLPIFKSSVTKKYQRTHYSMLCAILLLLLVLLVNIYMEYKIRNNWERRTHWKQFIKFPCCTESLKCTITLNVFSDTDSETLTVFSFLFLLSSSLRKKEQNCTSIICMICFTISLNFTLKPSIPCFFVTDHTHGCMRKDTLHQHNMTNIRLVKVPKRIGYKYKCC